MFATKYFICLLISSSDHPCEVGPRVTPMLQRGHLSPRTTKPLTQGPPKYIAELGSAAVMH